MQPKTLVVNVLPFTQNVKHLYTEIYQDQWELIASLAYKRAGGVCEYCGSDQGLVYHSAWSHDASCKVASLDAIELMCGDCYRAKSLDAFFAAKEVRDINLLNYLMSANQQKWEYAKANIDDALKRGLESSVILWRIDIGKQKSWVLSKLPIPQEYEEKEKEVLSLRSSICEYLAPDQNPENLEYSLANYARIGFREQNIQVEISYLKECLARLKKYQGDKRKMNCFEVSEVICGGVFGSTTHA